MQRFQLKLIQTKTFSNQGGFYFRNNVNGLNFEDKILGKSSVLKEDVVTFAGVSLLLRSKN